MTPQNGALKNRAPDLIPLPKLNHSICAMPKGRQITFYYRAHNSLLKKSILDFFNPGLVKVNFTKPHVSLII
jgi:hypothetical protein